MSEIPAPGSSRLPWATKQVPGQPGIYDKTPSCKPEKKKKDIFVNPPTSNFIGFEQSVTLLTIH
jgi:hypothetical protein